jgi:hypothetical protein
MSRSIAVLMLILCGRLPAAEAASEVEFNELVKHPQKYNSKRVSLRAYVVTSCTHCREFWASVQAAKKFGSRESKPQQCIAIGDLARGFKLPKWFSDKLRNQHYDGYVHVTGRFEYMPITSEILGRQPQRDGTERIIVQGTQAFDWGGIDDKQITDITEYRPTGPPIPAEQKWFMPRDASNQTMQPTADRRTVSLSYE